MGLTVTVNQAAAARRLGSPVIHLVTEDGTSTPLVYTPEQFTISGNGWAFEKTERPGLKPVWARRGQVLKTLSFTHAIVHSDYGLPWYRVDALRVLHESGVKVRMVGGSKQEAEGWWHITGLSVVVEERFPDQTVKKARLSWTFEEAPIEARPTISRTPPPAPPAPAPAVAAPAAGPASGGSTYTVVAGDSLWSIAAKLLGSGPRWREIANANSSKVPNPNRISPGLVLEIPAR